jgi:hypothetical protein
MRLVNTGTNVFAVGENAHSQEWLCHLHLLCAVTAGFVVVAHIGKPIADLATLRGGGSMPRL